MLQAEVPPPLGASAEPAISLWRLAGGIYGTHFDLYARAALQISARGEP